MTCVEGEDGPTCEKGVFRNNIPYRFGVIECNRGRDCGEDESCYQNPQLPGHHCDYGLTGIDELTEHALCTGPEDCTAYCRDGESQAAVCYVAPKHKDGGVCECVPQCSRDNQCANVCQYLSLRREEVQMNDEAFCDKRKGVCACRKPRK
jgi:hypothetical protein